ncbi:hypothetical protein EDC01DRAFT_676827 [Geopyxis carbonaria]|nr:hypothetical protein EDC01DRAFT_676827 [Geopyxis carbonaria]
MAPKGRGGGGGRSSGRGRVSSEPRVPMNSVYASYDAHWLLLALTVIWGIWLLTSTVTLLLARKNITHAPSRRRWYSSLKFALLLLVIAYALLLATHILMLTDQSVFSSFRLVPVFTLLFRQSAELVFVACAWYALHHRQKSLPGPTMWGLWKNVNIAVLALMACMVTATAGMGFYDAARNMQVDRGQFVRYSSIKFLTFHRLRLAVALDILLLVVIFCYQLLALTILSRLNSAKLPKRLTQVLAMVVLPALLVSQIWYVVVDAHWTLPSLGSPAYAASHQFSPALYIIDAVLSPIGKAIAGAGLVAIGRMMEPRWFLNRPGSMHISAPPLANTVPPVGTVPAAAGVGESEKLIELQGGALPAQHYNSHFPPTTTTTTPAYSPYAQTNTQGYSAYAPPPSTVTSVGRANTYAHPHHSWTPSTGNGPVPDGRHQSWGPGQRR